MDFIRLGGSNLHFPVLVTERWELNKNGFEVWIVGEQEPRKGNPDPVVVEPVMVWKRAMFNYSKLLFPLILTPRKTLRVLDKYCEILRTYLDDPRYICISVRELYFALDTVIKTKYENFLWALAMMLEFDDGYRYRFQHIFSKLIKELFYKNPTKEILRLKQIWLEHEKDDYTQRKIGPLITLLAYSLKIPKFRRWAIQVVEIIDLDKIKLDKADYYWASKRTTYDFN